MCETRKNGFAVCVKDTEWVLQRRKQPTFIQKQEQGAVYTLSKERCSISEAELAC